MNTNTNFFSYRIRIRYGYGYESITAGLDMILSQLDHQMMEVIMNMLLRHYSARLLIKNYIIVSASSLQSQPSILQPIELMPKLDGCGGQARLP